MRSYIINFKQAKCRIKINKQCNYYFENKTFKDIFKNTIIPKINSPLISDVTQFIKYKINVVL